MPDRPTESNLKKAVIEVLDGEGTPTEEIPVLFNPTEYSVDKSVTYGEQALPGLSTPVTQFVSGEAETLSMELFFDTYEEGIDVREHTDRIDALLEVDGDLHAPPVCTFAWGSLTFTSVVERANVRFTMFLPDGIPVRARADVTFREYTSPTEQKASEPRGSADTTKVRTVTESDTLWLIASREYGDPEMWRPIAEANGIENPRTLRAGRELVIPPLEP